VLVGDPGGNNVIEGGSNCALIAGGNGDVLTATEAGVGFLAAGGAETLVGGGEDLYDFVNGRSGTITIQNFSKPTDQVVLSGFAVNAAGIALAGATTTGGSEQISLSDGTRITFQGITGLTAANFA